MSDESREILNRLAEDLRREAMIFDSQCCTTREESECNGCRARMLRELAERLHHTAYRLNTRHIDYMWPAVRYFDH